MTKDRTLSKLPNTLRDMASEDDAPSDGKQYARKNGAWTEITPATGDPLPGYFAKPVRATPLLIKTGATSVKIPAGLVAAVGTAVVELEADLSLALDTDLVSGTAVAGADYFVYLKDDASAYLSASESETEGRLIGGFHYGLTGHAEAATGNKTEADMVKLRGINSHSFWDLAWRANKQTNRGLTYCEVAGWVDIYLADELYAVRGYSAPGGWIAAGAQSNGRKFPVIPEAYGGDGSANYGKLTPFVAWDMLNSAGMDSVSYQQFSHAMYGVQEGLAASGLESTIGRIEHYPQLTSRFGIEQATGTQWIWGADKGASSSGTWNSHADGRGQVYSGVVVALLGASRGNAAGRPGSRASGWGDGLAYSGWDVGVRGRRDHLILD